jgi:hypothetical protein
MKFLMADNVTDIQNAIDQINANCGWPDQYVDTWDVIEQAYNQDIWFFSNPKPEGYTNIIKSFTYEEMMADVVNVTTTNGDSSWWPPEEE